MKTRLINCFLILAFCLAANNTILAQNSVLVNFGSTACSDPLSPNFSLIKDPLGASPSLLASCDMKAQLATYFGEFVAYNPKDNKLYIADVNDFIQSRIWVLDIGLPASIACPASIPVDPNYSYNYVSNNFEFDNNGDLWSFSNYRPDSGLCNIDKFDVNTGNVLATRTIKFPGGNFPTTITSGDLTILPNGRMFATLGRDSSKLYEITSYNTGDTAIGIYLQTLPLNCFGIAYLNGQLEITGSDLVSSCYYFDYNISTNTLGNAKPFQLGQSAIDNTSFVPALGVTKRLINVVKLSSNKADVTYEVYVRNMGNVILNNIDVIDYLSAAFGVGSVSNVSVSFVPGANAGGLTLNPAYNGTTTINLLSPGQNLPNQTSSNTDYFFKLQVSCTVSNLECNTDYFNSAIGIATINTAVDPIIISDSSNNGTEAVVDPNNDGNAGGIGENTPTPFNLCSLPVHFLKVDASLINKSTAILKWTVATPIENGAKFEVQYSTDGNHWNPLAQMPITSNSQSSYEFSHQNIPLANLYYRIKQIDKDGSFIYSKIMLVVNRPGEKKFIIYPNPAANFFTISAPYDYTGKTDVELYDAIGKKITASKMTTATSEINTSRLPNGTYHLKLVHNNEVQFQKILVMH